MMQSHFDRFRDWQSEGIGEKIFLREKQLVNDLLQSQKPHLIVQLEGRALLDHFPEEGFYYHVSEDVNISAPGYSIEAEQGFLPFPDQSVDCLLLAHSLELYMAHTQLFLEMDRVLSPKGTIFIMVLVNKWLKDTFPKKFHPLGKLNIAPQSIRRVKKRLHAGGMEIVNSHSLIAENRIIADRIQEQMLYPLALEVKKLTPGWQGTVGVIK